MFHYIQNTQGPFPPFTHGLGLHRVTVPPHWDPPYMQGPSLPIVTVPPRNIYGHFLLRRTVLAFTLYFDNVKAKDGS